MLALGQAGAGDDAVGLVVAAALGERGVPVQRGDATALVELLGEADRVILVDAVRGPQPGRVRHLAEADLAGGLRPVSSHAMEVPQAIALARVLQPNIARLDIVGIEIGPPGYADTLSPPVQAAVVRAVDLVLALLAEPRHA